jgi:hypothetical protein
MRVIHRNGSTVPAAETGCANCANCANPPRRKSPKPPWRS